MSEQAQALEMTNEHTQDYGGTCDTCANGMAQMGSRQCRVCREREAEVDAHIDEYVFQQQLVAVADHYSAQIRAAQAIIDEVQPKLDTLRFLDPPSLDLEYRGVFGRTP